MLGGGLVGKGARGSFTEPSCVEAPAFSSIYLPVGGLSGDRSHPARLQLRRLPGMMKCQGSRGPLQGASPRWGPRAAGVGSQESLPASVLCAAWRGVWAADDSALPRAPPTSSHRGSPCLAGWEYPAARGAPRTRTGAETGQGWCVARDPAWVGHVGESAVVPALERGAFTCWARCSPGARNRPE